MHLIQRFSGIPKVFRFTSPLSRTALAIHIITTALWRVTGGLQASSGIFHPHGSVEFFQQAVLYPRYSIFLQCQQNTSIFSLLHSCSFYSPKFIQCIAMHHSRSTSLSVDLYKPISCQTEEIYTFLP